MNFKNFVLKIVSVIIFDDIKSNENILIYDISYKTLINSKPLWIRFFKIDGIIRIYDGTKYLTLLGLEKHEAICNTIRYLKSQKRWNHIYYFSLFRKNQHLYL